MSKSTKSYEERLLEMERREQESLEICSTETGITEAAESRRE